MLKEAIALSCLVQLNLFMRYIVLVLVLQSEKCYDAVLKFAARRRHNIVCSYAFR